MTLWESVQHSAAIAALVAKAKLERLLAELIELRLQAAEREPQHSQRMLARGRVCWTR